LMRSAIIWVVTAPHTPCRLNRSEHEAQLSAA
jgi:hypothetical protein